MPSTTHANAPEETGFRKFLGDRPFGSWLLLGLVVVVIAGASGAYFLLPGRSSEALDREPGPPAKAAPVAAEPGVVTLSQEQQEAIGLETRQAVEGAMHRVLTAPGQVTPDETRYAFITPRAPGPVRSVRAHIGQDVRAGDLLATIDSPDVAQARLDLLTRLQDLEIARTNADWQEQIYRATRDLIAMLEEDLPPDEIRKRLGERVVGENFERLMTAYANERLAVAAYRRSRDLREVNAVSVEVFQQRQAEYEAASATYDALMDSVQFAARLDHSKAVQRLEEAETAVRVAREKLRVLGVPAVDPGPSKSMEMVRLDPQSGHAAPSDSEGTPTAESDASLADGPRTVELPDGREITPISTYSIWAPFDGTVLDRELIVPGVYVDTAHRIFTIADLSKVWVRVKVHESEFRELVNLRGGKLNFTSPAYPGRVFEGRVLYTGDLVEEKTRAIQLLAEADNPGRLLKPGMFVQVDVIGASATEAVFIPRSALLSEGSARYVFVRTGPDRFERREVGLGEYDADRVAVTRGIRAGEEVVVRGAFKLKAAAERAGPAGPLAKAD